MGIEMTDDISPSPLHFVMRAASVELRVMTDDVWQVRLWARWYLLLMDAVIAIAHVAPLSAAPILWSLSIIIVASARDTSVMRACSCWIQSTPAACELRDGEMGSKKLINLTDLPLGDDRGWHTRACWSFYRVRGKLFLFEYFVVVWFNFHSDADVGKPLWKRFEQVYFKRISVENLWKILRRFSWDSEENPWGRFPENSGRNRNSEESP